MKKITLTMCVCGICLTVMIGCQSKETDIPSVEIVETLGEQGTDDSSENDALPEMKDEAKKIVGKMNQKRKALQICQKKKYLMQKSTPANLQMKCMEMLWKLYLQKRL